MNGRTFVHAEAFHLGSW